jgi:hypothetical protein
MPCNGSPASDLFAMVAWMDRLRPSAMIIKRNGDRGSPCLIPLVGEKGREGTPLMRIEKKEEEVRFMIQSTQEGSNPKARSIECIYSQLILSKSLERSSFKSIPGVRVFCREWITSCAKMTLSSICLPPHTLIALVK